MVVEVIMSLLTPRPDQNNSRMGSVGTIVQVETGKERMVTGLVMRVAGWYMVEEEG